jgi:hypothetical protein
VELTIYRGTLTSNAVSHGWTASNVGSGNVNSASGEALLVGGSTGANRDFDGEVALFGMVDQAWTLAQVIAQQWTLSPISPPYKVFWNLGFAGSASQTQPDWSGNGNNGTVTNATVAPHVPLPVFPFQTSMPYAVSAAGDTVLLDTASIDATVDNVSVVPSAASTTLDSLLLQSLLQDLNVSAGVATLSLDTLSLDIAPDDLSVVAGAVTLGVDSLLLQSLLGNINVLAGATSVGTTTLALNIQAGGTTVAVGVATIDLNTLSMNIAVDEASIVAGAASQSLESLLVQSALGNVTISVPANIRLPDKIRLMRTNQIPISQLQL